jgi:hypothetical protein
MHVLYTEFCSIAQKTALALCCPVDIAVTTVEHFVIFAAAGGGGGT